MKLRIVQEDDFDKMVDADLKRMERAHGRAMWTMADSVKAAWRSEIAAAGLGTKLGNTVRAEAYPKRSGGSLNAAALVWTKAPHILASHDEGTVIRSADGGWLAIPLPAAGRGRFGRKMTPAEYEQRTGQQLRFVYRRGRSALLVADDARLTKKGQARRKGGVAARTASCPDRRPCRSLS